MAGIFEWPNWKDCEPIKVNPSNRSTRRSIFDEEIEYITTKSKNKAVKNLFSLPDIVEIIKYHIIKMEVYEGLRRLKGYWVPKSAHQSDFAKVTVCSSCLLKISNANLTLKT